MTWLLDPRLNMAAGAVICVGCTVWTILSLILTNPSASQANVLAMSGVALVLVGVTMMQNALTMRKVEVTGS